MQAAKRRNDEEIVADGKDQQCGDPKDNVLAHHRDQGNPDGRDQDPAVEFVRVRGLVRTFTAVDIAQRHGDHDGADDNGPYDLGRTEIRCQQSAGSQFHRHDGHPGEELCEIQEQLIFQNS